MKCYNIDDLGKYLIKILIFIPNIIIDVDRLYAFMMTPLILAISAFGIIKFRRLRGLGILVLVSEFGLFSRIDDSKINILASLQKVQLTICHLEKFSMELSAKFFQILISDFH